ncbi:MAG: RsmB/NOP family class I SAM-dependent RNA methyltransferase [Nanoarchaeota archaeon]
MKIPELKPLLAERMKELLPDNEDFNSFLEILKKPTLNSIRCNTLKISSEKLIIRLESKGWKINQPFKDYPEILIIEGKFDNNINKLNDKEVDSHTNNNYHFASDSERKLQELEPGELGRSLEHLLGYYYVQEIASMLPVLVLEPKPNEIVLDLCASPGSKTTQIAAKMQNTGTIIANEISLGRIKILASNTERCGVTNTIITKKEGTALCTKLKKEGFECDRILIDAPCSGEGTLRSSPKTALMWNINTVKKLSKIQKNLLVAAIEILKNNGEIVYSTCTHAPEENEEVIDFILEKFKGKIILKKIKLPIKCRLGLKGWGGLEYNKELTNCCRIYPQDNDTEGFFLAKLKKVK